MKKKLFLSLGIMLLCTPLAGCATTSDTNSLTTLNNQLSRVENIVSSTSTTEVNSVSPYVSTGTTNSLNAYKAEAYTNMTNEEELRQKVLSINAKLKNSTSKYKLGKRKATALNHLTSNLSKYLNYLNNTKSEVKNTVSTLSKHSNVNSFNEEMTKSSYVTLSNLMNERIIYLDNIYCTLSQIENVLNNSKIEKSNDSSKTESTTNKTQEETCDDCKTPVNNRIFQPNVDTYTTFKRPRTKEERITEEHTNDTTQNDRVETNNNQEEHKGKNIDTLQNGNLPINNTNNLPSTTPAPYNGMYGYNYGYRYNGRYNRLNSGRNTDTFYPYMRNIDTYRYPPNFNGTGYDYYSGYNGLNINKEAISPTQSTPDKIKDGTENLDKQTDKDLSNKQENTEINENKIISNQELSKKTEQHQTNSELSISLNQEITKKEEKRHVI